MKVEIGDATLYLGDCLDILSTLEGIDCVITDPPYGVNNKCDYTRFTKIKSPECQNKHEQIEGDDKPFDPTPFLEFKEVILWGGQYYKDLPMGTWLVWVKKRKAALGTFLSDGELAWMKGGHGVYVFEHEWNGFMRDSEKGTSYHPAQKPVALMEWCLSKVKSDLIFDPYMGSGSIGIACLKTGRGYIGIEKKPVYFKIACDRIEREYNQGELFKNKKEGQ